MDWTEIISIAINSLILPILAWGVAELTKFLSLKIKNETAEKYITFAIEAVHSAVAETAQTYVTVLKENGEWNEETARTAFDNAKALALVTMGSTAQDIIREMTDDLDAWIEAQIEASTYALKGADKK